jgi:lysophospholipase L1-like esterase
MLMHKAVLHRDQRSLPKDVLNTLLPEYYSQYGIDGIHAFTSEGGSLFQEIITAIDEENINVTDLPLSPPAQYPGGSAPVFFQAPITQYTAQWQPPILFWSILSFSVVVVLLRIQYKRLASLLFAFSIILGGEGVLAWIDTPIQAEQSSLFSFVDFSFAPYQKHTRKDQNWWISQGGPARWQEIPEHSEIFRIAVLGASSAHASNLLQEEGFPAILEKTLQSEFPNKSIQVVNMGIGGTISNGILSSGTQAIEMGVDALIIYYGHNEVAQFQQIDQFGVSAQIWMRILFSQSRIYALLNHIFPSQPHKQQETIRTNTTARSDPERIIEWAAQNHLQNLSILLHDCSQKSIPVLQVTPTYNVLFAPFLPYSNEINTQAKRLLEEAQSLRPKNTQEAKNRVKQSIQYASNGSDVALKAHQIHAELLSEQGKLREARIEYQKIFDQADEITTIHSRVQKNILLLAQKYGTAHLDAEEVFYHHSKDGLSANELFWDELHPSQKGHQFLADAILPWARVQTSNFPDSSPNP